MTDTAGTSVVEAVVALLLGLFLIHLGLTTVEELRARQVDASRRVDALTATRVTRTVLRGELDRGGPADWTVDADSIRLRAFRGTGVVCGVDTSGLELRVAFVGDRLPEPTKDSVELTTADGSLLRHALQSAAPSASPCPMVEAGESTWRWILSGPASPDVVLARLYESGSYHLSGSAFRYRRGAGGRQPLTPPTWRDGGTGFGPVDSSAVMVLESAVSQGPTGSEFLVWLRQ